MVIQDTLIVPLSDLHSGGSTALFPNKFYQFQHSNHTPTDQQKAMYQHFSACADQVLRARKNKRLIVVVDGDGTEGVHHNSLQVVTRLVEEQISIHIDLMDFFLRTVKFGKHDELYYVKGTECHTGDVEDVIGNDLGAVPTADGLHAWDSLRLTVNGKRIWFTHHGPGSGKGAKKGNAMRVWLSDRFYEAVNEGEDPPHFIVTGHTHDPFYQVYVARYRGTYHALRGLICPSWQQRTRYANGKVPLDRNKIGLQYFSVSAAGDISDPVELLMK
jgi:predicted phosphodiesterase